MDSEPTTSPAPTAASTPKSSSRAKAEARRKRILGKSKDRLSVVLGEVVTSKDSSSKATTFTNDATEETPPKDSSESSDTTTVNDSKVEETAKSEGNDNVVVTDGTSADSNAVSTEEMKNETTPATSRGSARLAHMRRRRFKKASVGTETSSAKAETTEARDDNAESTSKDEAKTDGSKSEAGTDVSNEKSTPTVEDVSNKNTEKKKYVGVARMRRKLNAEKNAAAKAKDSGINASSKLKNSAPKIKKEKNAVISLAPIIIQLLTVAMLFFAGFDVGLQNHIVINQDVPNIQENFAFLDHGFGALKIVGMASAPASTPSQRPNDVIVQDTLFGFDDNELQDEEEFDKDEFAETKPMGASSSTKEPNIDPIFNVDFDVLLAGDGILMFVVRKAVSFHRMLTYLFMTLPLALFYGLLSLPQRMFVNPPILFLCAIIIRFVGKHLLGGSIPDVDKLLQAELKSENEGGMKKESNIAENIANADFLSMGTNFVKNFIKSNFPKVVLAYTIFTDARSDMFVIFCGFFFGLVAPVNLLGYAGSSVSDEL